MNLAAIENASGELRRLYSTEAAAARFFEWAVSRSSDPLETTIDQLEKSSATDRAWCIAFAKRLTRLGLGEYVVGRKGGLTRVQWKASVRAIGKAAKPMENESVSDGSFTASSANQHNGHANELTPLTISEAKRRLARSLGVNIESIEITIRS